MSSTSSNNFFQRIADRIYSLLFPGAYFEKKLLRCHGYRDNSVVKWRAKTGLNWGTTNKILRNLQVFDSQRIRDLIRTTVEARSDIFTPGNFYITSFGPLGKSGGVVFYDFFNATKISRETVEPWQIARLPSGSTIIFLDDLVGTGRQSVEYIQNRLSSLLSSSHKPYLFSICGTPKGIKHVKENSIFDVLCALELQDHEFNHYSSSNHTFDDSEKEKLKKLNSLLGQNAFDLGLLVAFHHSTPNNTMPFIWKDGWKYLNSEGQKDTWYALLPRSF